MPRRNPQPCDGTATVRVRHWTDTRAVLGFGPARRAFGTVTVWAMAALGCDGATPFPPEWQDASVAGDTATADDAGRDDVPAPRDTPTTEDAGHAGDVGGGGGRMFSRWCGTRAVTWCMAKTPRVRAPA